jgi:hypothetical protein
MAIQVPLALSFFLFETQKTTIEQLCGMTIA